MTDSRRKDIICSGRYCIGSSEKLDMSDVSIILGALNDSGMRKSLGRSLSGRVPVSKFVLPKHGSVVLKEYRRGGLVGKIIKNFHLGFTSSRSRDEFNYLKTVAALGINVPLPICYIHSRGFLYNAWLVTEEVKNGQSIVDIANSDESKVRESITIAASFIVKLIKSQILHVDLHPGNVLVGEDNKVYLIDFDKARHYKGSARDLRDYYLNRWRRACIKHSLPEYIHEAMSAELRQLQVWNSDCQGVLGS